MSLLAGRTALVTGGANGIGAAIVRRFLDEGARVATVDRDPAGEAAVAGFERDLAETGAHEQQIDLTGQVVTVDGGLTVTF